MVRRSKKPIIVAATSLILWFGASPCFAAPLDPNAYTSLGTLNVASGTLTFDTDTLTISGAFSGNGVIQSQGAGLPDIAVFTFDDLTIAAGVTLSFVGARPIALLSQGSATIDAAINVNGQRGADGNAGVAAGGAGRVGGFDGGASGGTFLTGAPPGQGPGGGGGGGSGPTHGASGGGGGFLTSASGGGAGGGGLEIAATGTLTLGAGVTASGGGGGFGSQSAGGGGSGGGILLHAATVSVAGTIAANGGGGGSQGPSGQYSGGGGGGGRVLVAQSSYTLGAPTPAVSVVGGVVQPYGGIAPPHAATGTPGVADLRPEMTIMATGQVRQVSADGTFTEAAGGWNLKTDGLQVNAGALAFSAQAVNSTHDLALNGGQVAAVAGWTMGGTAQISGFGTMSGALTGGAGNAINAAGGVLTLGDANSASGVNFGGAINVASGATLNLQDSNGATLQSSGTLNATDAAQIDGSFTNQGTVNGPSTVGQFLTFTDDVDGAGGYTGNVLFSDGFSPGNSPATVSMENVAFDSSATLLIELGGLAAASEHDRLSVSGAATLAGTLDVELIDDFAPALGDMFSVLTFNSRSGDFATYSDMELGGFLELRPKLLADRLELRARPQQDGDINLDGTVDIFDVGEVSDHWMQSGPQGDVNDDGTVDIFDVGEISDHWMESIGGGASAEQVPEPSAIALALAALASCLACARVRRR